MVSTWAVNRVVVPGEVDRVFGPGALATSGLEALARRLRLGLQYTLIALHHDEVGCVRIALKSLVLQRFYEKLERTDSSYRD